MKFSTKMNENCDFNEKEMVKRSYLHLRTKTLEKFEEESDKKRFRLDQLKRKSQKVFEKFEKV